MGQANELHSNLHLKHSRASILTTSPSKLSDAIDIAMPNCARDISPGETNATHYYIPKKIAHKN